MSEEYTGIDRMNAEGIEDDLAVFGISVSGRARDVLLDVAKKKGRYQNGVGPSSRVARCVAQMDSLMVGLAAGYNYSYDRKVSLGDKTLASAAFCNILGKDEYADTLREKLGVSYGEPIDFEKELVSCINGNSDSILIKITNDGILPDDKFTRVENRTNLQNMYMDAKLLKACGREGDILSLMNEVRDQHDVHNVEHGKEPKSQEEFDAELEKKIPMYKEAAEKLRADGKEVNISNLKSCVFDIERKKEAEQKGITYADKAKEEEKKATKKVPFWKKWFRKKKEDKVVDNDANKQKSVEKPKLTRAKLEKLQGLTPDRVPYKAEKREIDPNKLQYLNNNKGR